MTSRFLYYAKLFLVSEPQRTVRDDEVAPVCREPGIKTGYRLPNRSWGYYVTSLFHIHNETLNIWTHLVGCVVMVYMLCSYALLHGVWADEPRRMIHVFYFCAVLCTLISTLAHTFHNRSEMVHYISFQLDYAGIGVLVYSLGHIAFFISGHNKTIYETFEPTILPMTVILSWLYFVCCVYGQVVYGNQCALRKNMLQLGATVLHVVLACFGTLNRTYDCLFDEFCPIGNVAHHIKYYVFCSLAAFFFSSHLPERLIPGKCDVFGQGHQIFHICVIFMLYFQGTAADADVAQMEGTHPRTFPSWTMLITSLFCVLLLDALTMVAFHKRLVRKIQKEKKT